MGTDLKKKKQVITRKEYNKRVQLFSRYSQGVRISDVMLYSVTKEQIARKIAQEAYEKGYETVVDGCGGCGGNAIQFANVGMYVALVEINQDTIRDAKHNAGVYEVEEWIQFFNENILEFDCLNSAHFIPHESLFFASPQWGGPDYKHSKVFDLERMNPPLSKLLNYAKTQGFNETVIYAPRNADVDQAERMGCYHCQYMFIAGWCNAICLWFQTGGESVEVNGEKTHDQKLINK